jgi:hypothetical protein
MKRNPFLFLSSLLILILFVVLLRNQVVVDPVPVVPVVVGEDVITPTEPVEVQAVSLPTERYSAQVDRVKVIFEQWDYTRYRLQTNELVREGEMNSVRGFGDDPDATVYILNWRAPEGEQMRYVRLTAEPERLYTLDGYQNIIKSGALILEQ